MEQKTFYLVVYGKNQIPFKSLDAIVEYFQNSDSLFDGIMNDVKFYEMTIKPIVSPLNPSENG